MSSAEEENRAQRTRFAPPQSDGMVHVRGAREHNLKNVDLSIPRDALVVFTGVSGSGKSSLAFGTLYAEAQRRYLESVSPYARRLFHQMGVPQVDEIVGLPPAVALQQQRGSPTTRSSVGSVTMLSNLLRMLYSRAGDYPRGQPLLYAESFSPNTPQGACPTCHGLGRIYDATEASMVPDRTLSIRERAIAAWPPAWHGQNLRDIAVTLGFDIDKPWRELPKKDRDWLLFTDEQPTVPVYAGYEPHEVRRALKRALVTQRIVQDLEARIAVMLALGLGYLSLERSTPTLSPGELQRLRLATQVRSNLFGVVYVLDEPSAGLHPADTQALLAVLEQLKNVGNSLFVVEHELDVIRHADWIVDVGPAAGEQGGEVLYSGPPEGLTNVKASQTRRHLFSEVTLPARELRAPRGWLRLSGVTRNNLQDLDAQFPLGLLTSVTGVSGSGKSTLVSQVLVELVASHLGQEATDEEESSELERTIVRTLGGEITAGMEQLRRLVRVDQKPIGRTPRSNLATYTGLFDYVRKLFAATKAARARRYDAGRFSFNVAKGRCATCDGEGFVMVELLFLPSVYAPCPTCHGARYNAQTLEIRYREKNIAEVLGLTVDAAWEFFADAPHIHRSLSVLREVGLGYLRLGQAATELSGGEAQRIKLATELQRVSRGDTLYVLDEPTTGLHPADVERLVAQLERLVEAGNTVIVIEHDMRVVAGSDWVVDMGPGAGDEGGRVVATGIPVDIARSAGSRTAPYLAHFLRESASPP